MSEDQRRAALKARKESLHQQVRRALDLVRVQNQEIKALRQALAAGPADPPSLAAATGIAPQRVLWHLASLRKYGQVAEVDKRGSYFRYALTTSPPAAGDDERD
ncbi:MAG: hypothetical protein LDL07_02905 [Desulfarculus sp.]|nr:hypothetical protein [Desulfarculus sp.]